MGANVSVDEGLELRSGIYGERRPFLRTSRGRLQVMAGGAFVTAGAYLYPYVQGWVDRLTPGCLFHRVTGLPCLLCGMTRSMALTAHGRFSEAFAYHLLGPPLFFIVVGLTAALALEAFLGRRLVPSPGNRGVKRIFWAAMAALVAAWVGRFLLFGLNI